MGALALSLMPVFFMVLFNVYVLNGPCRSGSLCRNSTNWWISTTISSSARTADARQSRTPKPSCWPLPETKMLLSESLADPSWLAAILPGRGILAASMRRIAASKPHRELRRISGAEGPPPCVVSQGPFGWLSRFPSMSSQQRQAIEEYHQRVSTGSVRSAGPRIDLPSPADSHRAFHSLSSASWLALYLARQISGPISALLRAAEEVSKGNLAYRVNVTAIDELAQLVSGFNRMTADLEANRTEIEARRRFTEAILESIPTGVISVDSIGRDPARE